MSLAINVLKVQYRQVPKGPAKFGPHLGNGRITGDVGDLETALLVFAEMEDCEDVDTFSWGVDGSLIITNGEKGGDLILL